MLHRIQSGPMVDPPADPGETKHRNPSDETRKSENRRCHRPTAVALVVSALIVACAVAALSVVLSKPRHGIAAEGWDGMREISSMSKGIPERLVQFTGDIGEACEVRRHTISIRS